LITCQPFKAFGLTNPSDLGLEQSVILFQYHQYIFSFGVDV